MKSESKTENDTNDSTEKIVIESEKKNLNDITTTWTRHCPKCNKELVYTDKYRYTYAQRDSILCKSCCQKGKISHNKKTNLVDNCKTCPKCNKEIVFSTRPSFLRSVRNNSLCKTCSNLTYENPRFTGKKQGENYYKVNRMGKNHPQYGKPISKERREKMSLDMRLRRQSIYSIVNFNPKACEYFDRLNEQNKWELKHALNGGEVRVIGYSLDAYDKDRNIVVEYDEPKHYFRGKLREKDVLRQQRIITHLGCKFFRYNERTKELYEVKTSVTH